MVLLRLTALTVFITLPLNLLEAAEFKEVHLGDTVNLSCNLSIYNEIHWLRMSEGRPVALMVMTLKHNGELSVVWNCDESHFEGFMEKQLTVLKILHVSANDLTTYYCSRVQQKGLEFDKGVQLTLNTNHQHKEEATDHVQASSGGFDGLSLHYVVFAAVLCFGLLGMLLAVSVVHMKARTKENLQN